MAQTAACVDIIASNNATMQDAFQFGDEADLTWSLAGQSFIMEIKASRDDVAPLLALTSGAGEIVVDDIAKRVLHLNVPMAALQAALPVGEYVYDLIMVDGSTPPIRVQLMEGALCVKHGVTEN